MRGAVDLTMLNSSFKYGFLLNKDIVALTTLLIDTKFINATSLASNQSLTDAFSSNYVLVALKNRFSSHFEAMEAFGVLLPSFQQCFCVPRTRI